jgi:hypothetical protein
MPAVRPATLPTNASKHVEPIVRLAIGGARSIENIRLKASAGQKTPEIV